MKKKKVVLAYSGGLDTSVILKWLVNKGFDVICYVADVGQRDNFKEIEEKALHCGAADVFVEDMKEELVTDYIFPALMGNAMYEGRYLLGTSLARPVIARHHIRIAHEVGGDTVAHGATGKGNDQVRFEFGYYALDPDIHVIAPWKDPEFLESFKGRTDLLNYATEQGIEVKASLGKPYSEDENLFHISHEAGILESPDFVADEDVYSMTVSPVNAPDRETILEIDFQNGIPVKVSNFNDGTVREEPLELFLYLNEIGGENGVGRVDLVENRYIGIKSRGIYETPGGTILWAAHRDLEGIAMDKEVMRIRDMLTPKFSELIYNGYWFSPEMDFLMAAIEKSQEKIDGTVRLAVYKGNVMPIARNSPISLYNEKLSSMDIEGGFNQADSEGFIHINAIRLKAHNVLLKQTDPYKWRQRLVKK